MPAMPLQVLQRLWAAPNCCTTDFPRRRPSSRSPVPQVLVTHRSRSSAPRLDAAPALPRLFAVTAGGDGSFTVTGNAADAILPRASVAVQVTGVAPSGKVVPLAGTRVGVDSPSTTSLADATYVYGAP